MVVAVLLANLNCKRSDLVSIRLEQIRIRNNVRLIQELHLIWEKSLLFKVRFYYVST